MPAKVGIGQYIALEKCRALLSGKRPMLRNAVTSLFGRRNLTAKQQSFLAQELTKEQSIPMHTYLYAIKEIDAL